MGAHWEVGGEGVEIASNPGAANVVKQPVAWVEPSKYINYEVSLAPLPEFSIAEFFADLPSSQINASPELAGRVKDLLDDAGIESKLNPTVEWSESSDCTRSSPKANFDRLAKSTMSSSFSTGCFPNLRHQ